MTGIIDYAHTETRSFADLPFNEIDARSSPRSSMRMWPVSVRR